MKRLIILICFSSLYLTGISQSTGTWRSYLSRHNTTRIAEGNNYVFAIADGSLYSYNKDDKSIKYYAKETNPGLSDNNITSISFNTNENKLIITYQLGNIDLLDADGITNLPYLKDNGNIQNKAVNSIYNTNEFAYLSAEFGILVLNLKKKEVKETYRFSTSVTSSFIYGDSLYAVTPEGIKRGSVKDNLIDPGNWYNYPVIIPETENNTILQACVFQNALCFLIKNKGIYYKSGQNIQRLLSHNSLTNIKIENNKLIAYSPKQLYIYSSFTESDRADLDNISDISSLKNNKYWIAAANKGIIGIERTGSNTFKPIVSDLNLDGPKRNYADFLLMHNDKLYIAGGGRWINREGRHGTVMIYNTTEQSWTNLDNISSFWNKAIDATSIAVATDDDNHYFVSSWGEGVFEFKDHELIKQYGINNSILETAIENNPSYIRVEGLVFDKDNNLWMTNSSVSTTIKVLKNDGNWTQLSYPDINDAALADKIIIMNNGDKWINLGRDIKRGIFVFNENGTLDNTSDDTYKYFPNLTDIQGNIIGETEYFCIVKDKNESIWIGTNRGPVIASNPLQVLRNENTYFNRIIHKDENGQNTVFLRDERVRAIAVDGGNRKWIGTASSGAYLVSEDGTKIIEHFTTANSPLLSDNIMSIAINNKTGEVFFGTDQGLVSYWSDATEGSEDYSDVYAYPNPVRPNFDHKVIITGLMENSNVKITDVRGNLIYQAKSTGGQISWDCRNHNGKYVAAGVYLVLSSTPNAKESVVTKIAVVQ